MPQGYNMHSVFLHLEAVLQSTCFAHPFLLCLLITLVLFSCFQNTSCRYLFDADKHEYCGAPGSSCPRSLVRWVLFGLPLVSSLLATAILHCTHFHESPPSSPVVRPLKDDSLTSPLLSSEALLEAQPHVDTMGDDLWLSETVHRGRRIANDD